jgi:hypothetical protein
MTLGACAIEDEDGVYLRSTALMSCEDPAAQPIPPKLEAKSTHFLSRLPIIIPERWQDGLMLSKRQTVWGGLALAAFSVYGVWEGAGGSPNRHPSSDDQYHPFGVVGRRRDGGSWNSFGPNVNGGRFRLDQTERREADVTWVAADASSRLL